MKDFLSPGNDYFSLLLKIRHEFDRHPVEEKVEDKRQKENNNNIIRYGYII